MVDMSTYISIIKIGTVKINKKERSNMAASPRLTLRRKVKSQYQPPKRVIRKAPARKPVTKRDRRGGITL